MESGQSGGSGSAKGTEATPESPDSGTSVATRSEWDRTRPATDGDRYERWERHERRGSGGLLVGIILIVIGGIFLVREYVPALDWDRLWPIILIAVGVVLLLTAITGRDRRGSRRA